MNSAGEHRARGCDVQACAWREPCCGMASTPVVTPEGQSSYYQLQSEKSPVAAFTQNFLCVLTKQNRTGVT